jgi:hypothetical protein
MLETSAEVNQRLTREAGDRLARRMQNATSVGASDAILRDHKYTLDRIDRMTDEQLLERAIDPVAVAAAAEAEVEQRMHRALKAAWKYVNAPFTSNSARTQVGKYVEADNVSGKRIEMLFALQTAWTFVHGSGDEDLLNEMRQLLGHGDIWKELGTANA